MFYIALIKAILKLRISIQPFTRNESFYKTKIKYFLKKINFKKYVLSIS